MSKVINSFTGYYAFLSNFYKLDFPIIIHNIAYYTAEHAFQAAKSNSSSEKLLIARAKTPSEAKRVGRGLRLRKDWKEIKDEVMYNIVVSKFMNDQALEELLKQTREAKLIEGNTWNDTYWGVCNGKGLNKLGKILMRLRSRL